MVYFMYLWITPGFCCHADRRCADTHFRAMPTSHLFEVAFAIDGSEVSKLSRRYNRLKKKISIMADDPTTDAWVCPACGFAENSLDCLRCTMCTAARPRGSRSVLLVSRNSTHPVALAARGRKKPPKVRGAVPTTAPRESPPRGAKDRANERIAAQLAQRITVPVAEVVHSPESSPDGPLVPPPDAARAAGAGIVDVTAGGDSDDSDGSPIRPSRSLGLKTTCLELGDSSPNFSPRNSPESPTDNEVSKYSFFARLMHYMDGNKISEANRAAVEVCISVEAGAAVRSMDPMKKDKKERAYFNRYMGILDEIEDDQFGNESVREAMRRRYKKAKLDNNATRLWRKYESDLTELRNFAKKLPGVGSLSELPSGSNQLRHMKMPLVQKLWIEKHPV